ncbi:MAG: SPOR domain-containing protein, partial [Burkholderiales bacterium]|nr:SPOR domain-containing protein [Burkholderiales bacterium]
KTDVPVAQMQDPNKPLFGNKDAVAQAAKEVAASKAAEAAAASKPVDPAANVPAAAASVAATTPAVAAVAEDKFIYHLQIGAFKEVADAEAARAKLALIGIEASLTEKSGDGGSLHRVRVGPFDADAMNKMRARLSENGVESVVVRSAK